MKKILKFFVYWCIPGILLSPIGGCFTMSSHILGGSPSTSEAILCGTLDVVTMPVQIVVFVPMLVCECIDANTGVRGQRKRYQEEVSRIRDELTADFSMVFADPAFLSPTNTPQREALGKWLDWYGVNHPERELIDRLAERLLDNYEAAYALMSILPQKNLSPDLKKKLCVSLVEGSRTQTEERQSSVVHSIVYGKHLSKAELKSLVSGKSDSIDDAIERCLRKAEKDRMERFERNADIELLRVTHDSGGEMFMKVRLTNRNDQTIYLVGQDYSSLVVYSLSHDNRWAKTCWGADVIDLAQLKWHKLSPGASCEQMLRVPTACLNSPWYMVMFSYPRPELDAGPDGPILKSRIYVPTKDEKSGRYLFNLDNTIPRRSEI